VAPGFLDILLIVYICTNATKALIVFGRFAPAMDAALRRRVALTAVGVATFVCLLFAAIGRTLLVVFHISPAALAIAGGVILLTVALKLVSGDAAGSAKPDAPPARTPGIGLATYPLALPLMASPHGLVAIVSLTGSGSLEQAAMTSAAVVVVMAANLLVLLFAGTLLRALGPTTFKVAATVSGLLLAALAVQMVVDGLGDLGLVKAAGVR
jgi:multiple antibiotic resistance protein